MSDVILSDIKNRVGFIKLNRPESLNAFNYELSESLYSTIEKYNFSKEVGSILITGNGKAFSAGADVRGFQEGNTKKRHAKLIIMNGLSGSGKSYLSLKLARNIPAIHVRSDIERKRILLKNNDYKSYSNSTFYGINKISLVPKRDISLLYSKEK